MRVAPTTRRYAVRVTGIPRGDRWGICLELVTENGTVVKRPSIADLVFDTPADAEDAGWRIADEWISRLTGGGDGGDGSPLKPEERGLLVDCDHPVARCGACGLRHNLFELHADRYCARCRGDLTAAIRRHLWECNEIQIRRAGAATSASHAVLEENRRVRDTGGVLRVEAETIRTEAKRTRARRPKSPGTMCPVCGRPLIPGQPVSFRRGALVHLSCYENGTQAV